MFKREDWKSLAKINRSSKKEDILKVGRFGLGFLSVFHLTGKGEQLMGWRRERKRMENREFSGCRVHFRRGELLLWIHTTRMGLLSIQ